MHPPLRRRRGFGYGLSPRARARRPCSHAVRSTPVRPGPFAVMVERLGNDGAALRLTGELDVAAVPALDEALRRVERWSVVTVLVDAADLGFVDVTVVGRLMAAHGRLHAARGGGLVVVHAPPCLLRLLEVLGQPGLLIVR